MEERDTNLTVDTTVSTGAEVQEVATPEVNGQVEQTASTGVKTEQDSYFADMRRKQEMEQFRNENAQLKAQLEQAQSAFSKYFDGSTLQEQIDFAVAETRGVDVSEIIAEREASAQQAQIKAELDFYKAQHTNQIMSAELKEIQAIDPSVTNLDALGPTFAALRFNKEAPMSATQAYLASKAIEKQMKTPKPASTGSVTGTGTAESEFYSSRELDKIDKAAMNDPKVYEKVMRSLARLK